VSRVANRYSKALFELALEQGKLDMVMTDLEMIGEVLEQSEDFRNAMMNPLIQAATKAKLLRDLFEGRVDKLTFQFLTLVSEKKRSSELAPIIDRMRQRVNEHKGILVGELICAVPLAQEQQSAIIKRMNEITGKKVQLTQTIDKSLIGGFVVKIKDTVIDLSISHQLENLRERLVFGT